MVSVVITNKKGEQTTYTAESLEELQELYHAKHKAMYPDRQRFKLKETLKNLESGSLKAQGVKDGAELVFKDLGPQVGWSTVFLTEYAGPLFVYLLFFLRPSFIYGQTTAGFSTAATYAGYCWIFHYAKRLYETLFVHRFSHATMPIMNIIKNSGYYWGFTALVAYYVNHPLFTSPSQTQVLVGLVGFLLCEYGNYSIHIALRDLRPPGTKDRKIPMPTANPMTFLFNFVCCPNYTYEAGSWFFFTLMTQSLTAGLFFIVGLLQMTQWAIDKRKRYIIEFPTGPRRKAIIPFVV
jgi:very-long-chain enoyl-CoA reductase